VEAAFCKLSCMGMAQPASMIIDVGSADTNAFVPRNKQRPFMWFATLSFCARELRLRSVSGTRVERAWRSSCR
jgi:hypothetical protein